MPEVPALIWLAYASLLVLSLLDNLRAPFFPDILLDLHLNSTLGATFFATTSLFAFVGSWTSHHIVHRHSSTFLLGLANVAVAIGFAATSRTHSLITLLPCCALFGWGYGALNLAQNLMIFEGAAPARRRRMFNGLHSMYGISALIAPAVASLFRIWGADWRDCFLVLALAPLLVGFIGSRAHAAKTVHEPATRELTRAQWMYCAMFSLMMAFYLWGEISISTRMVQWLRAERAFTPDGANLYLGVFFLALLAGRVFFSFVHFERVDNWRILLISSLCAGLLFILGLSVSPMWFVPCALAMSPFFPVAMEQVSHAFGTKATRALGFVLGAGSLSVVVMHLTLGVLTDAFGVGNALIVGPVCFLIVAAGLSVKAWRVRLSSAYAARP